MGTFEIEGMGDGEPLFIILYSYGVFMVLSKLLGGVRVLPVGTNDVPGFCMRLMISAFLSDWFTVS